MSGNTYATASATQGIDVGLRSHMLKTYNLISLGLILSAASAFLIAETPVRDVFFTEGNRLSAIGWAGMLAPLGLLLLASFGKIGKTLSGVRNLYWAFAALQGIGLSVLAAQHSAGNVGKALALTGFTFAATSLYGYVTRKNLTGMGSFMVIGLIGIIIASIVNIFLASPAVDFAVSIIGVIVFAGLTAYDTQNLKESYSIAVGEEEQAKTRYWGALGLYLNIINLFNFFLNLTRN